MKRKFLCGIVGFSLLAATFASWKAFPAYRSEHPAINSADAGAINTPAATDTVQKVSAEAPYSSYVSGLYKSLELSKTGLVDTVFTKALTGFHNLKIAGKLPADHTILSIVDFSRPSGEKRLWIINLKEKKILFHTLVAHGKGSGGDRASNFSNKAESHQSSLGFYLTGEVYYGKHGRSLRLDGMDPGFNTNARERAIVLHGASYVSKSFIHRAGRLGRSYGCPAVPMSLSNDIIDIIKNKTVLFISGPGEGYRSKYLDKTLAATAVLP